MNTDVRRHPVRGTLWGLLFGIGLYFLAVGRKLVALGSWWPLILLVVVGIAVNLAWAMFGPARSAADPAATAAMAPLPPEPLPMPPEPGPMP